MIVLDPNKMTGKQVTEIISKAIKRHTKKTGVRVTWADFIRASGLSKQQVIRYKRGGGIGVIGAYHVAAALKSWGNKVEVKKIDIKFPK
jgi:hypothetical protein